MQPAGEGIKDYSFFAEQYRKKVKAIADLKSRISQREKFAASEESAGYKDIAEKMRAEILELEEEIEAMDEKSKGDLKIHRRLTEYLRELGPEDKAGHA